MSDKNDKAREILDKSDYEYEKKIYEDEKRRQQELEAKKQAAIAARKKREKEAIKERERQLARERIELMKKKNTEDSTLQESGQEEDAQEAQENTEFHLSEQVVAYSCRLCCIYCGIYNLSSASDQKSRPYGYDDSQQRSYH